MEIVIKNGRVESITRFVKNLEPNFKEIEKIKSFSFNITDDMKPVINEIGMDTYTMTYTNDITITLNDIGITIQSKLDFLNIQNIHLIDVLSFLRNLEHTEYLIRDLLFSNKQIRNIHDIVYNVITDTHESYFDITDRNINIHLNDYFKPPVLKSQQPTLDEIAEYSKKMEFSNSIEDLGKSVIYKNNPMSVLIGILRDYIYIELREYYNEEVSNNKDLVNDLIYSLPTAFDISKLQEEFKNMKFEYAKTKIEELESKYDDIQKFLK